MCALEKYPDRWKFPPLRALCGGTAPPLDLIRALDKHGIHIMHAVGHDRNLSARDRSALVKSHMHDYDEDDAYEFRGKQGLAPCRLSSFASCVPKIPKMRTARKRSRLRATARLRGELEIRGPWIAASYYNAPDQSHRWTADGWFRTGDVATMDEEGYIKIVDRAKDLVKSGGEWISSVDLENTLMGHPAVKEAAWSACRIPSGKSARSRQLC